MIHLARYYVAEMRMGASRELQYRASAYFLLIGFLVDPVVYLVVWTTVAEAQGGSVAGYTSDAFAAYFIVWTLVRAMNLALTPYVWDWRVQRGRLSDFLLRPIHPIHRDIAWFAGSKLVWIVMWLPIAFVLFLTFRPSVSPSAWQVVGFSIAIWGGFVVRFLVLYVLGLLSFWTTRASAVFEIVVAGELVLSGRLVPLALMPDWVQRVADFLPFQWTFQFPIETLIGRLDDGAIAAGLGMQVVWAAALGFMATQVWKRAIRRYTAVGT